MAGKLHDQDIVVRQSVSSDDDRLADLFNDIYADVPGVLRRSPEDLAWRCRRFPGMSPEGALLVEDRDGTLLGYAFVKDSGEIIELAVDPLESSPGTVFLLVAACEEQAIATGAERLTVNMPTVAPGVASALTEVGLAPSTIEGLMYASAVDPAALMKQLAVRLDTSRLSLAVTIRISDPLDGQPDEYLVHVGSTPSEDDLIIECTYHTLNAVLLAGASPGREALAGRLNVRPRSQTIKAIRLLNDLKVRDRWFYTLGDVL